MIKLKFYLLIVCLFTFSSNCSIANNISVSNFRLTGQNKTDHFTMVKFDISWENSFRESTGPSNWDAAWVFVKYRQGADAWQHAWLNNIGHLNPAGSTITTGLLDPALPFNPTTNPGIGAFIYRDANGSGTFSKTGVQLRWNYGANGLSDTAKIDVKVFAIEMVYVPQGSFYVGSGGTESSAFYKYPLKTNPYQITSEEAINVGTVNNNLFYTPCQYCGDELGPIPATFPKGYNAFYCMKYEITQQGYTDFLNNLTSLQASNRYSNGTGYRYRIIFSNGVYSTTNPFVACNMLHELDIAAYLDWSGLRPMTELEFEKACRGPLTPVPNEYAWGTTSITSDPYTLSDIGTTNENIATNYSTTLGNSASAQNNAYINGPVRVGIFAGNGLNTGRVSSGATYYGIMEMSGNVWERVIGVGLPLGRAFNGSHGNGILSADGFSDQSTWPAPPNGEGSGIRGGTFISYGAYRISERHLSTYIIHRNHEAGGRGIRTAP